MLAYFVIGIIFNFTEAAFFRIMHPVWFVLLLAITRIPDVQRPRQLPPSGPRRAERAAPVRVGVYEDIRQHAVPVSRSA